MSLNTTYGEIAGNRDILDVLPRPTAVLGDVTKVSIADKAVNSLRGVCSSRDATTLTAENHTSGILNGTCVDKKSGPTPSFLYPIRTDINHLVGIFCTGHFTET